MKVVVAHNRYQSSQPSGENAVVDADIAMLRDAGVEVIPFIKDSDSLMSATSKLKASTGPIWAPATREFARLLDAEKPDVLHLHNVYPLISPWAVRTAKARGAAVVQTMHNYRHQCVAGLHLREGKVCEDCTPTGLGLAAVKHACYRGSRIQSAAMVAGRAVHGTTWQMVDRYFALTPFMADRLVAQGISRDRLAIRPTSCPDPGPMQAPDQQTVLFVGRLEEAKGVELLLNAWSASTASRRGWKLVLAGSGPMEPLVQERAELDPSIEYAGSLRSEALRTRYRECAYVAVPSLCFEGFPRVVAEACSHGRPILGSSLGSIGTVAITVGGEPVAPTQTAWVAALDLLDLDSAVVDGKQARQYYEGHLTLERNLEQLLDGYATAISSNPDGG